MGSLQRLTNTLIDVEPNQPHKHPPPPDATLLGNTEPCELFAAIKLQSLGAFYAFFIINNVQQRFELPSRLFRSLEHGQMSLGLSR